MGAPQDVTLHSLGAKFYEHIQSKNTAKAQQTLEKIEKRAAKLIPIELKRQKAQIEKDKKELEKREKQLAEFAAQ